jgi:hypothetical protein
MTTRALALITIVSVVSAVAAACGSSGKNSEFGNGEQDGSVDPIYNDAGFGPLDGAFDPDAFWAKDPPPQWCGPGDKTPVPPGGSPECPSDKNREGCACTTPGEKAPCWPGLRAQRGLGICKDGETTCLLKGENARVWGPCVGAVLPQAGATKGAPACKCFSQGHWKIPNVRPCFHTYTAQGQQPMKWVASTLKSTMDCYNGYYGPINPNAPVEPTTPPPEVWSANTLQVDCEGDFTLYLTIKAGDIANPSPSHCTIARVSTTGSYPKKGEVTPFPDLPGWISNDDTCANRFHTEGGYAELSVKGKSWLCENIDDGSGGEYVFQRFKYCPLICNDQPTLPQCLNCQNGASGTF